MEFVAIGYDLWPNGRVHAQHKIDVHEYGVNNCNPELVDRADKEQQPGAHSLHFSDRLSNQRFSEKGAGQRHTAPHPAPISG